MAQNSKIEWCDHTFNPWEGCTKVSPGCANCYAEARNARFGGGTAPNWGPGKPRRRTSAANWLQPVKWDRDARLRAEALTRVPPLARKFENWHRPRVFCASLADVFDPEVPDAWRDELFDLIYRCKNLDWLILTKQPALAADYLLGSSLAGAANLEEGGIFEHLWLGTTAEDQQRADERIPELLRIPAYVRFVSCEPLLGPVTLPRLYGAGVDWVICGGESGPHARPMHPDWARDLRDQCYEEGIPFFFKQWGEWLPGCQYRAGDKERLREKAQHTFDADNHSFLVGKHAAGRLLGDVEHNEFPS